MTSFYDITEEELIKILKKYNKDCNDSLNDYSTIIKRAEINTEWNDVLFRFAYGNILLDIDDLSYKEGQPNNATITKHILPENESDKVNDDYIQDRLKYYDKNGRFIGE